MSCTQVLYAEDLTPIPSEFIEPYAQRFLMMQLESVAYGLITPAEAKEYLKGVEYFIDAFAGIHARMATSNIYGNTQSLSDDELLKIAKKTFKINS